MEFQDFIITPLFILIILGAARQHARKRLPQHPEYRWYVPGLSVKILGAVSLGLIYTFYYQGGDTFGYFNGGKAWVHFFLDNPAGALSFLREKPFGPHYFDFLGYAPPEYYHIFKDSQALAVTKITGLLSLLSFNSYYGTATLFALLSYTGIWALFRVFTGLYPGREKTAAVAVLFLPSVFFWGSGILKDTITLGALGWMTWGVWKLLIRRQEMPKALFLILLNGWLIASIKGYILLAWMPGALLWVGSHYRQQLPSGALRTLLLPFFLGLIALSSWLLVGEIGDKLGRYSVDNLESTARGFQSWHQVASEGGSGYVLETAGDFSPSTLMGTFPKAVSITLFRPFPWETSSLVILLAALESFSVLVLTLLALWRNRFFGFFRKALSDPFLLSALLFSLIFAFATGYTSFNFGALVRYKIPLMPFYVGALLMLLPPRKAEAKETVRG